MPMKLVMSIEYAAVLLLEWIQEGQSARTFEKNHFCTQHAGTSIYTRVDTIIIK